MNEALAKEMHRLDGMFVGLLTDDEIDMFDEAVRRGIACRSYEGAGGFMGLAKVRVNLTIGDRA